MGHSAFVALVLLLNVIVDIFSCSYGHVTLSVLFVLLLISYQYPKAWGNGRRAVWAVGALVGGLGKSSPEETRTILTFETSHTFG